jgi:hypothetical protein
MRCFCLGPVSMWTPRIRLAMTPRTHPDVTNSHQSFRFIPSSLNLEKLPHAKLNSPQPHHANGSRRLNANLARARRNERRYARRRSRWPRWGSTSTVLEPRKIRWNHKIMQRQLCYVLEDANIPSWEVQQIFRYMLNVSVAQEYLAFVNVTYPVNTNSVRGWTQNCQQHTYSTSYMYNREIRQVCISQTGVTLQQGKRPKTSQAKKQKRGAQENSLQCR